MNIIASTIEIKNIIDEPIEAFGLTYRGADAVIPAGGNNSEVRLRLLCYDRQGPKLDTFLNMKVGNRVLATGSIIFSEDTAKPLDVVVTTLETNIPQDMYLNQVVLGNAFFATNEVKERKNNTIATKIGTTLDNSSVTTWLFMETHDSRRQKLNARIRKGRPICVEGYIREYRKDSDSSDSPYRAIVANDFSTRKDREQGGNNPQTKGTASGYTEVDPTPDY